MSDLPYPIAFADGFGIGMFVSHGDGGDAWVTAPDGSDCGLNSEPGEPRSFEVSIPVAGAGPAVRSWPDSG